MYPIGVSKGAILRVGAIEKRLGKEVTVAPGRLEIIPTERSNDDGANPITACLSGITN